MTRLLWLVLALLFLVVLGCAHAPTVMAPRFDADTLYVCRATGPDSIQCQRFKDFLRQWQAAQASREETKL